MPPVESAVSSPPYAMYAELVIGAPIVADATIRSASRLKPAEAPDLAPGFARFYVEADVSSLIRSPAPLPPRIGYLYNAPLDAQGRAPRIGKARVLLFARTAAQPGQIQLVRPDAQQGWTPGGDALARRIVQEVLAADAPPAIGGVGKAFHVPGALPGEGETQIFLNTAGGRPVSLSVARAADGQRSWSVSLSEIVDAAAAPPPRDTLLWYRLACGLPATLPEASVAAIEPSDAAIARDDYAFVLGALGPCHRGGAS
ncbi:MAG: hypothetical protein ABIS14_00465 [Sphingomonas sp.]